MFGLLLGDAAHRAVVRAGAAVNALAGVDEVTAQSVVHGDGLVGAGIAAGAAGNTTITDNVHSFCPPCLFSRGGGFQHDYHNI